jgi:hypothetical protein
MPTDLIASMILAVCTGGGLTAVVNWLASRRKLGADAVRVYTDTTLLLLEPMREEIKRLEIRVRTAGDQLTVASALLRAHNIAWPLGETPPPWS